MKNIKIFTSAMIMALITATASLTAAGFDIDLGPFQFQLQGNTWGGSPNQERFNFDRPICYSIENLNRVELIMEVREEVNSKETKVSIKKVIVDPYQFGISPRGEPILQGNVVDTKVLKEISIKYYDESFKADDQQRWGNRAIVTTPKDQKNGKAINIANVSNIRVLDDVHFAVPKDIDKQLDKDTRDDVQVICRVSAPPAPPQKPTK